MLLSPQPAESVPAPVAPNATSTPPTRAAAIEVKPAADTPQAPVTAPAIEDPKAVALALQQGLKSAGCYSGDADGRWGDKSSRALSDFAAHARMTLYSLEPTKAALTAVQSKAGVICPVTCVGGETKVDGRCRPIAAALEKPRPAATPASPVPQQVSTPDCACPQMRTCTGSWKTMSCPCGP